MALRVPTIDVSVVDLTVELETRLQPAVRCGCGSKPMVPFWGRCTTHLVYFSGDWDVHWGYGLWTHGHVLPFCLEGESLSSTGKVKQSKPISIKQINYHKSTSEAATHPFTTANEQKTRFKQQQKVNARSVCSRGTLRRRRRPTRRSVQR